MSISQARRSKEKKRDLFYKSLSLFLFLITINAIWILFFYEDDTLKIIYGILTPLLYCLYYYRIKKTRKRLKTKIKSHIYIPITYIFFGVSWYLLVILFVYVSDKIEGDKDEVYKANIEAINEQKNDTEFQITDSKNLFETLNIQTYFLFNPNLAYPCKVAEEIEFIFTKKSKNSTVHHSKQQANMIITFVILFLIQIGAIYISENIIYQKIRPKVITRRKRIHTFLKIEDVFINEKRVDEAVKLTPKSNQTDFPKL
jgi:Ca2+/Na+ antiporter